MSLSWDELKPYADLVNTEQVEPRAYQISIIKSFEEGKNELVVLPTGLGKTLISVFAIAMALYKGKKALMLAPTKPLSEQHFKSISSLLKVDQSVVLLLTGMTKASKRAEASLNSRVIIGTPQTIANDLAKGRLGLSEFGVVVFDECHRAVGRYAYTYIANECKLRGIQVLGLTASPGSDRKKISELVDALGINRIEVRSASDPDVKPYIKGNEIKTLYIENSQPIKTIASMLKPLINQHLRRLYEMGLSPFSDFERMPKKRFLAVGDSIQKIEAQNYRFAAIFHYVYVLDLLHAYDLVSSEGLYPFVNYIESLQTKEKKSKVVENIIKSPQVIASMRIATEALGKGQEHPKMLELVRIINSEFNGRSVIIFAQFRSTIRSITKTLQDNGISARGFVGKSEGIKQAEQISIIKEFGEGKFRVLVATSIGEEGLDIPVVDGVIFYEPIPSEIRTIQRKGRTGRFRFGEVIILVARGTKDEGYLMISRIREKRMLDTVIKIKEQIESGKYKPGGLRKQARL